MDTEEVIRTLIRSRLFEEKIDEEFKNGNLYGTTHLSIGQEGSHTGLAFALEKGDWFVPTHRCHGFNIASGSNIEAMFSEMLGSRHGLCKGLGGSMHMTDIAHGDLGSSAVVGSGIPLALGASYALKRQNKNNIAVAIFGDGASSRGTLHESMNLSSVWNLPILFFMENNHYGMSASSSRMIASKDIASRSSGYDIEYRTVFGNDFDEVYNSVKEAREYILKNKRPFFIEVDTYRQCGHSKSDKLLYRTREEERVWKEKDPIALYCSKHNIDESALAQLIEDEKDKILSSWNNAWEKKDDILTIEEVSSLLSAPRNVYVSSSTGAVHRATYREALREALCEILSSNERTSLIGEDISVYGGCFSVTGDMYKKFSSQMYETPVSEETFTGLAVGSAFLGERPIVEIMYGDFLTLASDPIVNHASKSYFMSAGQLKCPVIIRTAFGGGTGHGAQHTQCLENMFLNIPGMCVVAPSDARTAKALLKGAANENQPVIFLEHKALYNDVDSDVGDENFIIPLGKAIVSGKGRKLLVIGYSRPFKRAKDILIEKECTFLDIASLSPLDETSIREYARSFNSILILEDVPLKGSIAETVYRIVKEENSNAQVRILSSLPLPLAFSKSIERETLLSKEAILKAAEELLDEL